jgi:hypothetical protein
MFDVDECYDFAIRRAGTSVAVARGETVDVECSTFFENSLPEILGQVRPVFYCKFVLYGTW